jgi:hypothetical protein
LLPDIEFTDTDDQVIAKAFERVRDGLSADRLLADPEHAIRFDRLCAQLGVKQPPAAINRRLLRLRKASGGGQLKPTSRREVFADLTEVLGPAVEFALAKVRVRYGASVDDVLADPDIGAEFETVAREITPGHSPLEYRICALQIRKNRHLERREEALFDLLDSRGVLAEVSEIGTLDTIREDRAPADPGILLVGEALRPLYLFRHHNLKQGAEVLRSARLVRGLEMNSLWTPDPHCIPVSFIDANELEDGSPRLWELRLIKDLGPVFNWPVRRKRRAA